MDRKLRPGPRGHAPKSEPPVIPDSTPPIYLIPWAARPFGMSPVVTLRIGGPTPQRTVASRTVQLTLDQAEALGRALADARRQLAPRGRRAPHRPRRLPDTGP
jgi:hypothetical protein